LSVADGDAGVWDEFSLYLDDKLPKPLPIDF
jgi:hypothetical protein